MAVHSHKAFRAARKYGYRSGLELKISEYLNDLKVKYDYETIKIEWEDLAYRTYTPDFILNNGIIIESKGMFTAADRRKHLAIKRQHPTLDIRFVFENSRKKLEKVLSQHTQSGVLNMDLDILGCGTIIPGEHRSPCSGYLIDNQLLIDCGPGIWHALCKNNLNISCLDYILLSHFHIDHCSDHCLCRRLTGRRPGNVRC